MATGELRTRVSFRVDMSEPDTFVSQCPCPSTVIQMLIKARQVPEPHLNTQIPYMQPFVMLDDDVMLAGAVIKFNIVFVPAW